MHGQRARIAFFAISAYVTECHSGSMRQCYWLGFPDLAIESDFSAMQRVRTVIEEERVFLAIECELSLGDSVAVAAYRRAKKRMIAKVAGQIVKTKHHIGVLSGFVRHPKLCQRRAVADYLGDGALGIGQSVLINFRAVG